MAAVPKKITFREATNRMRKSRNIFLQIDAIISLGVGDRFFLEFLPNTSKLHKRITRTFLYRKKKA